MDPNDESDVKFDTDTEAEPKNWQAVKYYQETTTPKMIGWVIKSSGGSITEKQAEYVLLGFVIVAITISLFLIFSGRSSNDINLKPQELYPPGSPALR